MNYIDLKLKDASMIYVDVSSLRCFQVKENKGGTEFLSSIAEQDKVQATFNY